MICPLTSSLSQNCLLKRTAPQFLSLAHRPLENINLILPSDSMNGALYLGDIITLRKPELLKKHKIEAILSCMPETPENTSQQISQLAKLRKFIPSKDIPEYPIHNHFEEVFQFIGYSRRSGKNVLVHCHAGVSRSATIVCAYLMKENSWNFIQAFDFLKSRRERVRPNIGFIDQLKKYEQQIVSQQNLGRHRQAISKDKRQIMKQLEDNSRLRATSSPKTLYVHQNINKMTSSMQLEKRQYIPNIFSQSFDIKTSESRIMTEKSQNQAIKKPISYAVRLKQRLREELSNQQSRVIEKTYVNQKSRFIRNIPVQQHSRISDTQSKVLTEMKINENDRYKINRAYSEDKNRQQKRQAFGSAFKAKLNIQKDPTSACKLLTYQNSNSKQNQINQECYGSQRKQVMRKNQYKAQLKKVPIMRNFR